MDIATYLAANSIRQADFARAISTDRGHLNNVIAGRAKASPALSIRIEAETGGAVPREAVRPDIYRPALAGEGEAA